MILRRGNARRGKHGTLEVCELAEMLALAVKLSAAGVGDYDYWDLADRWTRCLPCWPRGRVATTGVTRSG